MTFHTAAEVAALFPKATERWVTNLARAGDVAYTLGPKRAVLFTDEQRDAFIASRGSAPVSRPARRARRTS